MTKTEKPALNVICRQNVEIRDPGLDCVAVDAGLLYARQQGLNIIQVIGDFDSSDSTVYLEYQTILIKAEKEKDSSDLQLALDYLRGYCGAIYIYGALGGRMDHNFVNLKLCYYSELDIHLIDKQNEIFCLKPGYHTLEENSYKYVSFFSFQDCRLSLSGFKYPLNNYLLRCNDNLTLSNEMTIAPSVVINDSKCLVFLSHD